jgi:hypothetical protein
MMIISTAAPMNQWLLPAVDVPRETSRMQPGGTLVTLSMGLRFKKQFNFS